jgi:DNA-binding NarL/FixJ family response regulator
MPMRGPTPPPPGRHWGDRWWWAVARALEGEAAGMAGAAHRAADALRDAHGAAVSMGAATLGAQIEAIARRSRLSLDAPTPVTLGATTVDQLGLTPREAEVLSLVSAGLTNRQIGEQLFVSEKTASVHVSNILAKLGAAGRTEAVALARRRGLLTDEQS